MSSRLEAELEKIKYANITKVSNTKYFVKKEEKIRLEEGRCYLIKINPQLMNSDNIVAINWNDGRFPKCTYYQIEILKSMTNMIKVVGAGCSDTSFTKIEDNFNGWLPTELIEVLSII